MSKGSVKFHDLHPTVGNMLTEVLSGLSQTPRSISPKYLYDEKGSQLFDEITELEDYYPTRTEIGILQKNKQDIVQSLPKDCLLIEPGGGSCSKVRIFIETLRPQAYVPMDISREHLLSSANQMSIEMPWLNIQTVCNDFSVDLALPANLPKNPRVVFFPGSSVGNFQPSDAVKFLSNVANLLGENGQLLIGVDLKKDKNILQRAYDDAEGITAQFNLNLLTRLNNELSADFDLSAWEHFAFYNFDEGRIEMHLESQCDQLVHIHTDEFYFAQSEKIHTENSYKYTVDEFQELAKQAQLLPQKVWLDDNNLFSVHLFSAKKI